MLGVILAHTIHALSEKAIDLRQIHHRIDMDKIGKQQSKSLFEIGENLNAVVASAKKLKAPQGIVVVNLGANDILEKNTDIVLGLVWQLVRAHLLRDVNLVSRPELIRLVAKGETLKDMLEMPSEALLIRWVNFHLAKATGADSLAPIKNFSADIADGKVYLRLLDQLLPRSYDRTTLTEALRSSSADLRVQTALDIAESINCRRFVTARDILAGQSRLNLAFTAGIFNEYIGIVLPTDEEVRALINRVEDLEIENGQLRNELAKREQEMQDMLAEVGKLKDEWLTQQADEGANARRQVQELTARYQAEVEAIKRKSSEDLEARENELQTILQSVKAKSKQQMLQYDRQNEKMRAQLTRELNTIKTSLEDFLASNGLIEKEALTEEPESTDASSTSPESLTPLLKRHLVKILEGYYEQSDKVKQMDQRLVHMARVNDAIGDKIQEYAEGLIDGKEKKNRRGFFGLV